jgi:hypothetical protein
MTVAKLKGARDRNRATGAKVEGRKSYVEREKGAELVALAPRKLRRYPSQGKRRSLCEVSAELAAKGFVSASGKPFEATAVARMIGRRINAGGST